MFSKLSNIARVVLIALAATSTTAMAAGPLMYVLTSRVEALSSRSHYVHVGQRDNYLVVDGDGDTDLDCWIYDSRGRLVASDTDETDYCVLETPGLGQHRVVIENLGTVYNRYVVRKGDL